MLINNTIIEFLDTTKSDAPTPGGGSVSALTGALGSALTLMVSNLSVGKKSFEELSQDEKNLFEINGNKMEDIYKEMIILIDKDTMAFDEVMKAFKLPKATDEEKGIRTKKIQEGYIIAMEVPFYCAKKAYDALCLQEVFAKNGNINAISDIGVGILLLATAIEGAIMNVLINLNSIKDEKVVSETKKEIETLMTNMQEKKKQLLEIVYSRLQKVF